MGGRARLGSGQWEERAGRMEAAEARAAAALERLGALSCPSVVSLPPPQALQLLCSPSRRRQELLEWLCCRVYPPLAASLDALQGAPKDSRLREIAKLGAKLRLCQAEDLALVEGTAPPQQQLQFLEDLLAAAPPPGQDEDPRKTCRRWTQFLQQLLETPQGKAALTPPDPSPLPTSAHPHPGPPPQMPTRCQLQQLEAEDPKLGRGSSGSAPPPNSVLPTLGVAGGDLRALVDAFGGSELCDPPWGGVRPLPTPHSLAGPPQAPKVVGGLQQLGQTLGAVTQLQEAAAEVKEFGEGSQQRGRETQLAALWRRFGETPPQIRGGRPLLK